MSISGSFFKNLKNVTSCKQGVRKLFQKYFKKVLVGLDNRYIFAPPKSDIKNGFTFIEIQIK